MQMNVKQEVGGAEWEGFPEASLCRRGAVADTELGAEWSSHWSPGSAPPSLTHMLLGSCCFPEGRSLTFAQVRLLADSRWPMALLQSCDPSRHHLSVPPSMGIPITRGLESIGGMIVHCRWGGGVEERT